MDPHPANRPTLLVFTLGARLESRRRRLLPASLSPLETRLHRACLESTLAAGRAAGCRLEVSSPLEIDLPGDVHRRRQRGGDFGSRLDRALGETFAECGGTVMLVGSDVPDLDADHLRRTLELLGEDPERVVIGPSPDGGIYLLASARPLGLELSRVRWRCRGTLASLRRELEAAGLETVLLPPLADLDRRADLEHWLAAGGRRGRTLHWRRLRVRLAQVLGDLKRSRVAAPALRARHRSPRTLPLRGPPAPPAPPASL